MWKGTCCPFSFRSKPPTWWRKARISTSFSRSFIGSIRSIANAFVTPRYASLSSTTDHQAAPTGAARYWPDLNLS
ncbi:hypothetical protein [Streptomyces albogriseolus]|uniref:hypothetical protein n=1 Tax=Streptomyces albogriseolus TaxID=1887 RepID=UPI0033AA3083